MTQYYRILAGKGSKYTAECFAGGFIGVDFDFGQDLTNHLPDNWRDFNEEFIPIYLANNPGKTKVAAGLACGMTHTVAKGLQIGDAILCPNGKGSYRMGKVTGSYQYHPGEILPHRRPVEWFPNEILRDAMSEGLRQSSGAGGILSNVAAYAEEIEKLISSDKGPILTVENDEMVEDPYAFAMEKHLEEFIVQNWEHTFFAGGYKLFEDGEGNTGQQFDVGDGRIDILAVGKDQKSLLVIELKKGRASDVVVGQTLRYMGYVKEVLADKDQEVKGAIIALDDDPKLRRALKMVPQIEFYRYRISFKLEKQ